MRPDMDKVIVERQRIGSDRNNDQKGDVKRWQRARASDELFPKRTSTARRRRSDYKELNEHLGPLRRFLNTRCGQNWDKVYSEIRENISPSSTQQMHILQHLHDYVEMDIKVWPDGTMTDTEGHPLYNGWFVNPKTGCLQKNMDSWMHGGNNISRYHQTYAGRKKRAKYVKIGSQNFAEIDGIWYEVEFSKITLPSNISEKRRHYYSFRESSPLLYDIIFKTCPTYGQLVDEYGSYCHATNKRQIGSKEIKRFKLRQDDNRIPDSPSRR